MKPKKKKVLGGLHNLRTSLSARVRSMPQARGQAFLDAYMTIKKMEVLENLRDSALRRQEQAEESLSRITEELGKTNLQDVMRKEFEVSGIFTLPWPDEAKESLDPGGQQAGETENEHPFGTIKFTY